MDFLLWLYPGNVEQVHCPHSSCGQVHFKETSKRGFEELFFRFYYRYFLKDWNRKKQLHLYLQKNCFNPCITLWSPSKLVMDEFSCNDYDKWLSILTWLMHTTCTNLEISCYRLVANNDHVIHHSHLVQRVMEVFEHTLVHKSWNVEILLMLNFQDIKELVWRIHKSSIYSHS